MIIYYSENYTGGRAESRRLLKEALAFYTGDRDAAGELAAEIKTGEHGKPYIEGFSCFSVSHTGSIWAVLFCECECGLDIQRDRSCDMMAVARRVYAPEDVQILQDLYMQNEEKARGEFFRMWSRREALVKALGGSVTDSDLPSVSGGKASLCGRNFYIDDVVLPELPVYGPENLYCAICLEGADPAGLPVIQHLPESSDRNDNER